MTDEELNKVVFSDIFNNREQELKELKEAKKPKKLTLLQKISLSIMFIVGSIAAIPILTIYGAILSVTAACSLLVDCLKLWGK